MKALRTANKVSLLVLRCSSEYTEGSAAGALLTRLAGQSICGASNSQASACSQHLIRGFASGSDTQQHVAQGDTRAPPIANAAADDSAKASTHVLNIDTKAAAERRNEQHQQAQQSLATSAPEAAAAMPAEEQPQQPQAAAHQQETLDKLQADSGAAKLKAEKKKLRLKLKRERNRDRKASSKAAAAAAAKQNQPADQQADDLVASAAATATASGQQSSAAPDQQPASAASSAEAEKLTWRQQQKLGQQLKRAAQGKKSPAQEGLVMGPNGLWQKPKTTKGSQGKGRKKAPGPVPAPADPQAAQEAQKRKRLSETETLQQMEQVVRGILYSDKATADLTESNITQYYPLSVQSIPEAFSDFYKGSLTTDGGCKGLQEELAFSNTDQILYRSCIHQLHQKAAAQKKKHLYLDGPAGCGKSIALASLVAWARSQGWLVMYVPRAADLIEGGTFTKAADGLWETPEVARLLLKSMLASHEKQLSELQYSQGGTLLKMVQEGISASQPGTVTHAAAKLVSEMATLQTPVLIAVDGYNILYSHTNYHEWMSEVHRRQIHPHELRLASAFRILEQQGPKQGLFVGSASHGGPVSQRLQPPRPSNSLHTIPKLELAEAAQQLCHYTAQGLSEELPELHAFEYVYFMTGGSARELRLHRRTLMANRPTAVNFNDMDNTYQYALDSNVQGQFALNSNVQSQGVSA